MCTLQSRMRIRDLAGDEERQSRPCSGLAARAQQEAGWSSCDSRRGRHGWQQQGDARPRLTTSGACGCSLAALLFFRCLRQAATGARWPGWKGDAVVVHAAGQGELRRVMGVLQRLVKNSLPRWPRRRHA